MAYTLRMLCSTGVATCTLSYTYGGVGRSVSGSNLSILFDEGTTVYLAGFAFASGYGYPITVTNLGTMNSASYNSASWIFNSAVGGAPPASGYMLEATYIGVKTYYGSVTLNGNGGDLGGIESYKSWAIEALRTAVYTFPAAIPTRNGYAFAGWGNAASSPTAVYSAGSQVIVQLGETYPGPNTNFYAQWTKSSSGGGAWINTGSGFVNATPYVWNGSWQKATPYIYNGGWKKGV